MITDAPTGARTSAIASGDLALVGDYDLRVLLAGWDSRLADMAHTEENISEHIRGALIPDLSQRARLPYVGAPVTPSFEAALLSVPAKNHLDNVAMVSEIVIGENEALQVAVADILSMLQEGSDG